MSLDDFEIPVVTFVVAIANLKPTLDEYFKAKLTMPMRVLAKSYRNQMRDAGLDDQTLKTLEQNQDTAEFRALIQVGVARCYRDVVAACLDPDHSPLQTAEVLLENCLIQAVNQETVVVSLIMPDEEIFQRLKVALNDDLASKA